MGGSLVFSEYTESLRGTNAKAKANASQGIPELLRIAQGKYFRENKAAKHKRNAKYGWYRYNSRFALLVYGSNNEIERYNVFHASMLIRCANDGKMYLYDIIDIKKEATVTDGLAIYQTDVADCESDVTQWLDKVGISR